uniref:Tubulin-specific chaperone A n=1 Tax=Meloidogyne javanica TaxID=6303 RepID=A0A915LJW1_MELJA
MSLLNMKYLNKQLEQSHHKVYEGQAGICQSHMRLAQECRKAFNVAVKELRKLVIKEADEKETYQACPSDDMYGVDVEGNEKLLALTVKCNDLAAKMCFHAKEFKKAEAESDKANIKTEADAEYEKLWGIKHDPDDDW